MSLHDYLTKQYGSVTNKSKKKVHKPQNNSKSSPTSDSNLVITEDVTQIVPPPNLRASETTGKKALWRDLASNELVSYKDTQSEEESELQTAQEQKHDQSADSKVSQVKNSQITETIHRDERGHKLSQQQIVNKKKEIDLREKIKQERLKRLNAGELQVYMRSNNLTYESLRKRPPVQSANLSFLGDDTQDPALLFSDSRDIESRSVPVSVLGRRLYDKVPRENRFGIQPGCRWDGVDRSNGFESRWFEKKSELEQKKAGRYAANSDF